MIRSFAAKHSISPALRHVVEASIALSVIAALADVAAISWVNSELSGTSGFVRLIIGTSVLILVPYFIYLLIIRTVIRPLANRLGWTPGLSLSIFYCLGLVPLDFLIARDISLHAALDSIQVAQVRFFTLRTDVLLIVILAGLAIGSLTGWLRARRERSLPAARLPRTARVTVAVIILVALAAPYIPVLLRGPVTTGTMPSGSPLAGRQANVVLISIDTMRADELGCYGAEITQTPNIDKIAGVSIVFDNAVTPIPMTGPSHMSMMTGLQPDKVVGHGVTSNGVPLPDGIPTLATVLDSAGYQTGAVIGGLPLSRVSCGLERGFHFYQDVFNDRIDTVMFAGFLRSTTVFRAVQKVLTLFGTTFPYIKKPADEVTDQAIGWLADKSSEPFFLFVHYYDVHGPYDSLEPFDSMYSVEDALRQQPPDHPYAYQEWKTHPMHDRESLADRRTRYRAETSFVDEQIGRLIDWGTESGLWENTLLIITSDHGEAFDSDYTGHINRLYESIVRIPMIIRDPRPTETARNESTVENTSGSGNRSDMLVNVSDIFFTVLSFLDVEPPESSIDGTTAAPGAVDNWGHDLADIWQSTPQSEGDRQGWDYVAMMTHGAPGPNDARIGRLFALRFPTWKLIYGPDAWPYYHEYQAFDVVNDPYETVDRFGVWDWTSGGGTSGDRQLAPEALAQWASTQRRNPSDENPDENSGVSLQDIEALRALGYIQ
jgi:arylsulfatase A-like enzyme